MNEKLIDILTCPKCKDNIEISNIEYQKNDTIIHGTLKCDCGCEYPIINGLPRMINEINVDVKKTKQVYSKEWDLYDYNDENDDTWLNLDEEKRVKRFLTAFGIKPEDLKGKTVLDAGCGNGRLSHSISKLGCHVFAFDISSGIEHAAKKYRNKNLHYIQADITNIPLKEKSFDYIWSAGVLHHTPDTKKSFKNLVPLLKKKGTLYVWVYGWYKRNLKAILWWGGWKFIMIWPDFIKEFFCNLYVPCRVLKEAIMLKKPITSKSARQKRRAFYDNINQYMYHHHPNEVKHWFSQHNFKNIEIPIEDFDTFCGFGTRGIKTKYSKM